MLSICLKIANFVSLPMQQLIEIYFKLLNSYVFFEFLFRKKVMKSYNEQQPSYNQDNTLNNKPIDSGTMYVEQYVKESIEDLKKTYKAFHKSPRGRSNLSRSVPVHERFISDRL